MFNKSSGTVLTFMAIYLIYVKKNYSEINLLLIVVMFYKINFYCKDIFVFYMITVRWGK